jgi:glutamate racemase
VDHNEVVVLSKNAPIGAFDSGVGGLSILLEVRRLLPAEDLVYLADSAHCPYGIKPVEDIRQRSLEVTDFLVSLGVKLIVVACNSACVAGLDLVRAKYRELPIVGVEPAIKPAHDITRNGKIGVLATKITLNGERFSILV